MNDVERPAAWRGAELSTTDDWCLGFDAFGLEPVVDHATALGTRIVRGEIDLVDVPAPAADGLHRLGAAMREHLVDGRGFVLVRGLPLDALDEPAQEVLLWLIGRQIGAPLHQNAAGDVLVRVRDEGKDFTDGGVRAYETTARLEYHTDSSDVVGLMCRRPARHGGVSTIVSSVTVHDELARRRPDLAPLLFEPWPELNPVDGSVTYRPIAARSTSGRLASRYGRKYTELAARAAGVPLTDAQIETLDLYDELTNDPELVLNMHFRPGDVQFLLNHSVLHARTDYEDGSDPTQRRELLRIWLVVPGLDVPDVFADAGFIARSAVRSTG